MSSLAKGKEAIKTHISFSSNSSSRSRRQAVDDSPLTALDRFPISITVGSREAPSIAWTGFFELSTISDEELAPLTDAVRKAPNVCARQTRASLFKDTPFPEQSPLIVVLGTDEHALLGALSATIVFLWDRTDAWQPAVLVVEIDASQANKFMRVRAP
ncbi:hypothetical protein Q5752_000068 [Cryptotrichosporon argae]